jgi:hypothetical protein
MVRYKKDCHVSSTNINPQIDNLYWSKRKRELIQDGGQINRETDIYQYHRGLGPIFIICLPAFQPLFLIGHYL